MIEAETGHLGCINIGLDDVNDSFVSCKSFVCNAQINASNMQKIYAISAVSIEVFVLFVILFYYYELKSFKFCLDLGFVAKFAKNIRVYGL